MSRAGWKSPLDELKALDRVAWQVARELVKTNSLSTHSRLEAVTLGVAVYRAILAGKCTLASAKAMCSRNTDLRTRTAPCSDLKGLKEVIGRLVVPELRLPKASAMNLTKSTFNRAVCSHVPKASLSGPDFNREVKETMGNNPSTLNFVVEDGVRVEDPEAMAAALKRTWEPVWKGSPVSKRRIDRYLRAYKKRVAQAPSEVSLEDVLMVLSRPRGSCPGPNGIPFLVYSVLCDIAGPIFLRVIQHLMGGGAPGSGFNSSLVFFLPKDGTHRPDRTRPIAASNTSNRIIANIVRWKIEASILGLLDDSQAGFVRGRRIDDNISFFNEKFYSALYTRYSPHHPGPGIHYSRKDGSSWTQADNPVPKDPGKHRDYHILFLDFKTAFPSISRDYLLRLLHKVGLPASYCNIIRALFHDVVAQPVVPGRTTVCIDMPDGLKQGCPLAPLFFILAIDPLLSALANVPGTDERCFADDLALGLTDITMLAAALPMVQAWSEVSRCRTNIDKTKIITTAPEPPSLDFLSGEWKGIKVSASYVYLGILIGRSVDVSMVYEKAVAKLKGKVSRFMPSQRYFSLAKRVRIANMYLLPILSYISRFFLMSEITAKEVRRLLRVWLVIGNCTTVDRLMAPAHAGGLARPLRNPEWMNVAAITGWKEDALEIPGDDSLGVCSMLVRDHRTHAAMSARDRLGAIGLDPGASQRERYKALAHADPTPTSRLIATLRTRERRHGSGRDPVRLARCVVETSMVLPDCSLPALRDHLFNLVHNLIFTNHRTRRYKGEEGCAFCGAEREDYQHMFVECDLANLTLNGIGRHCKGKVAGSQLGFLRSASEAHYRLEVEGTTQDQLRALASFSLAVWRTRRYFAGGALPSLQQGASIALAQYQWLFKNWKGCKPRDRQLEKVMFEACLRAIPFDSYHYYTDGSSYGNPGPAGAGVVGYCRGDLTGVWTKSLGVASNNAAELEGILVALEKAQAAMEPLPIYVFVDNRAAVQIAIGRANPGWCLELAAHIREVLVTLSARHEVHFFWVPGHADVDGNEIADKAAKVGAMGISRSYAELKDLPDVVPPAPAAGPSQDVKEVAARSAEGCARCVAALESSITSVRRGRRSRGGRGPRSDRLRAVQSRHRYGTRSTSSKPVRLSSSNTDIGNVSSAPCPSVVFREPRISFSSNLPRPAPRGSDCLGANFPT